MDESTQVLLGAATGIAVFVVAVLAGPAVCSFVYANWESILHSLVGLSIVSMAITGVVFIWRLMKEMF